MHWRCCEEQDLASANLVGSFLEFHPSFLESKFGGELLSVSLCFLQQVANILKSTS